MFVLGRVIYKTMSDSDVAKLTPVIKLEHFNCSNYIKELAFLSLVVLLVLAFLAEVRIRTPKDEFSLQNGDFFQFYDSWGKSESRFLKGK